MGQSEIYEYLIKRRIEGKHEYVSVAQLHRELHHNGFDGNVWYVNRDVHKLGQYDYLDYEEGKMYKFRIKLKYVKKWLGEQDGRRS